MYSLIKGKDFEMHSKLLLSEFILALYHSVIQVLSESVVHHRPLVYNFLLADNTIECVHAFVVSLRFKEIQ